MRTAIDVQQLAQARPRFPPPPMPTARAMLLDQPRRLQRLFQEAVRDAHAVLASRDLIKVSDVEAAIALPIQPEQSLDLRRRDPTHGGLMAPFVDQPDIAM